MVSGLGEDLYNILKIELEQSIGSMLKLLMSSKHEDVTWISLFNQLFSWFEGQIVSRSGLLGMAD